MDFSHNGFLRKEGVSFLFNLHIQVITATKIKNIFQKAGY